MTSEKQSNSNDHDNDLFGSISITEKAVTKKTLSKASRRKSRTRKPQEAKKKRSRLPALIIGFLLILSCYLLGGFFLVPYLLTTTIAEQISAKLQVELRIEEAQFNPITFHLKLANLSVDIIDHSFDPQLFTARNLESKLDILAILRGDWVCSKLDISGLDATIIRDAAKNYNISYLIESGSEGQQSEIIDFAELPFLFSLNNVQISDSTVTFIDDVTEKKHLISEIELALPALSNFAYQTDSYLQPRFSAVVNGSPVLLTGDSTTTELADGRKTILSCDLDNVDLGLYFDYLPVAMPISIKNGMIDGKLQISFSAEKEAGSTLLIQLNLSIQNLELESKSNQLTLQVPAAKLEGNIEPFAQKLLLTNVLFREPQIILGEKFSSETLQNLSALSLRPLPDDPLFKMIPGIGIKLFIADGGTIFKKTKRTKKALKTWQALQLSVKNFNNSAQPPGSQYRSSFRLSGEHSRSKAFFNWQGELNNKNQPSGNIQLNNIPLKEIAPFLASSPKEIKGTADLSGLLALTLDENETLPFDYSLKSTRVTVKDLRLRDRGIEWLFVPVLECNPVSRINGVLDLGNISMANSTAQLVRGRVPRLFSLFQGNPARQLLHGIDFSGKVKVFGENLKTPVLNLSESIFKANNLTQQTTSEDNFTFSASINRTGSVRAKGLFTITPVEIKADLAFINLRPNQLVTWFSKDPSLRGIKGEVSGKGLFKYPQREFTGSLAAKELIIGQVQKPVLESKKVLFEEFNWSMSRKSLSIGNIFLNQPSLSWQRVQGEVNPLLPTSVFLRHIFLPEPKSTKNDPDTDLSKFTLMLENVDIENGSVYYQDFRTDEPLALGLTGITGSLSSIEYPVVKKPNSLVLSGNIEGTPFTIEGSANLMQDPPSAQYVFKAQTLPLALFADQIAAQIRGIDATNATADITVKEQIHSDGRSRLTSLVLNRVVPKNNDTPAALALALISGNSDQISLELSSNKGNDVKPLVSTIINDFGKNVIKSTINPFLVTDKSFSDLVDNHDISFSPNSAMLDTKGLEQLSRISEFLSAHPRIKLQITGFADREFDQNKLQKVLDESEFQRIQRENEKRRKEWQKQKEEKEMLQALDESTTDQGFTEADISDQEFPEFVPLTPQKVSVSDNMLEELAAKRAETVRQTLIDSLAVPPEQTTIIKQKSPILKSRVSNQVRLSLAPYFDVQE